MLCPTGLNSILSKEINAYILFMSISLHFIYLYFTPTAVKHLLLFLIIFYLSPLTSPLDFSFFATHCLSSKSWATGSCIRWARTLLVGTKWRVSVLSSSNNIAKTSSWFAFICRKANNMQVQVHTPLPHISFLQLLIQFDRCPIWVGYIAFSVDRNSTLVEILYKGTVAPTN